MHRVPRHAQSASLQSKPSPIIMNASATTPIASVSDRRLTKVLLSVVSMVVAADFLFWYEPPGLSLALFVIVLASVIIANADLRQIKPRGFFVALLLLAAAVQSA